MELQFTIRPGLSPMDRGDLEELVIEALGDGAECLGGGGMLDGSMSDFTVEVEGLEPEEIIERCRSAFAPIAFAMPTAVELQIDDRLISLQTAIEDDA